MSIHRDKLPQLHGTVCLTDGGLETDLCFNHGIDLPEFAAYDLLRTEQGRDILRAYYQRYVDIAARYALGLVLDTPTWRANTDWGARLGDAAAALRELNLAAVALLQQLRRDNAAAGVPLVISGCLGPRGDGYASGKRMSASEASDYHAPQIATFAGSSVDMVAALTMNYVEEAIGVVQAAKSQNLPVCISFTVETDGRLPTGESLAHAIAAVDEATAGGPAYYMINCAHPSHFDHLFADPGQGLQRVRGLRGNASCLSHEALDNADVLDDGDPDAFGRELRELRQRAPQLTVLGGCCGTDHRHLEQVGRQLAGLALRGAREGKAA